MSEKLIRIYKKFDVKEIKKHLLIYGDLSGACGNCDEMNVKLDATICGKCGTDFKYISFRNVSTQIPKMNKIIEQRGHILLIDFDDYKRSLGALKAEEFLK